MALKKKYTFETTFNKYTALEVIGEGGSGRIFKVLDESDDLYAIKLLDERKVTRDKIKRFRNEINFCTKYKHPNIVPIHDHGVFKVEQVSTPFYVMPLFQASLRELINDGIPPEKVLIYFDKMLSGIQAAHLRNVIHRDIKPENILYDKDFDNLLICDFGIAHFEEDDLLTAVETKDRERLANYQYASPEQRSRGQQVEIRADIYALGLILNEMFTKIVPAGSGYKTIISLYKDFEYLDDLVSDMIRQLPDDRPESIESVKNILIGYKNQFVTRQKINELDKTVIPTTDIDDDPLIADPPRLINYDWDRNFLTLILSNSVNQIWIWAFQNMGSHHSVLGKGPERFNLSQNKATINCGADDVQRIIDYFKNWLPRVNTVYKQRIQRERREAEEVQRRKLEQEIEVQRERENVLKKVKI